MPKNKKQQTELQQNQKNQTHIIQVILDDYEKGDKISEGKKRWRSYPDKKAEWKNFRRKVF